MFSTKKLFNSVNLIIAPKKLKKNIISILQRSYTIEFPNDSYRIPRKKKKTFAEAEFARIKKYKKEFKKEKLRRKLLYGYCSEYLINEKKFRHLKKYKEREEIKLINERNMKNLIRLPRRRK